MAEMKRWWREQDYLENIHEKQIHENMHLDDIVEFIYRDIQQKESKI